MMTDGEDGDHPDIGPEYLPRAEIIPGSLFAALKNLQLMESDFFLTQQAFNLDIIDQFLLDIEQQVLQELFATDRTPANTHFLNAQSTMWIFAAYELLRTWDQRARDIIKWSEAGGLKQKLESLKKKKDGYAHHGREMIISQLEEVIGRPEIVVSLDRHRRHLHVPFTRLEHLRVAIAKHEVSGHEKSIAYFPGYGRINKYCGSLDYQLENGKFIIGNISRRDIADSIRALALESEPPDDEAIKSFDDFMGGREV